jgi:uncharacterized membrane protein YbjE (DUF340 family)
MLTPFDFLTVACLLAVGGGFFFLTDREPRKLLHLLLSGLLFAVANQLGNSGSTLFALVLIAAGLTYSVIVIRN